MLTKSVITKTLSYSKSKDHTERLQYRLTLWDEGKIDELIKEGETIQKKLQSTKKRNTEDTARIFSKLVFQGKISAALKFLSKESENGVLPTTDKVISELKEKHPDPSSIQPDSLIHGPIEHVSKNYFDDIDEDTIKKAAKLTRGAGGPSQFDADQFRRILCSNSFKSEGRLLREQIAKFAKIIASSVIDPTCLEAYIACRLIPLNKNPGIRPIGIGEILRRIVGKAIGWTLNSDIQLAAGPLQASTDLKGGAEAAIHTMKDIFEADDTEGVILVDASNAFNSLNRKVALYNIQYICPPFANILINTYRHPSRLFIAGGREILSQEGTTQGDNLAMSFYGLGTNTLLNTLKQKVSEIKQVWLADDATGAGRLIFLRK